MISFSTIAYYCRCELELYLSEVSRQFDYFSSQYGFIVFWKLFILKLFFKFPFFFFYSWKCWWTSRICEQDSPAGLLQTVSWRTNKLWIYFFILIHFYSAFGICSGVVPCSARARVQVATSKFKSDVIEWTLPKVLPHSPVVTHLQYTYTFLHSQVSFVCISPNDSFKSRISNHF